MLKHRAPTRLPQKMNVKKWGRVLGLSPDEIATIAEAAELTTPTRIQQLVSELKSRNR